MFKSELENVVVVDDPGKVQDAVSELGLNYNNLMSAIDEVYSQLNDYSPFDALSAPGLKAYLSGVRTLREGHISHGWTIDRQDNVETIINEDKTLRVGYQTVDQACVKEILPQPRTRKGAASQRQCQPNLFEFSDVALPPSPKTISQRVAFIYFMVDEGGRAELSQPIIKNGLYTAFVRRIFLCGGKDQTDMILGAGSNIRDPIDDFDVAITSRQD